MYYVTILQGNKRDFKKLKICSFNQSGESASAESLKISLSVLKSWFDLIRIDFDDGIHNFQFTCSNTEYEKLCLLYKLEQI